MREVSPLVISLICAAGCAGAPRPLAADPKFPLLNPILALSADAGISELQPFNHKIKALVADRVRGKVVDHVSVYFRDFEAGSMKGVNFDEKFTPASLLKVPMLIAALKQAEKDPSFLKRRLRLGVPFRGASYLSAPALVPGQEYSLEEVLRAMAVSSDNDAFMMLKDAVDPVEQSAVYRDFGLVIPDVRTLDDSMTVREYATFFRVLYNASYLNKASSQKALEYLSKSAFVDGLVAGVPAGVTVAHKFGERFTEDGARRQLHDCGVVYHPGRPYILCIMTRGDDFAKLSGVIRDLSSLVYGEVSANERR